MSNTVVMRVKIDNEPRVAMPKRLTAENGAKRLLSGEFHEEIEVPCTECYSGSEDDPNSDCDICAGSGAFVQKVPVTWETIKRIYAMAADHLGKPLEA